MPVDISKSPAGVSEAKSAQLFNLDSDQLKARVAWFYFIGGLTQQEIADQLDITRLRVNKILGQVRTDGSVVVDIRLPLAGCVELERRLVQHFGLHQVTVVPTVPDPAELQRVIGEAAGQMLEANLSDGIGMGVGWGKTLAAGIKRMSSRSLPDSWVTSLMGGVTRGSGFSTFEVATNYAAVLGAECYYLAAPLYFPTAESKEALLGHLGISETLRRAKSVDVALVSCGDLSEKSQLYRVPSVSENIQALEQAGGVGDLLGYVLDRDGMPVDHTLNQRVLSLPLESLKAIPKSILASGGTHKVDIILAILRAGYVNRLVTDEQCAAQLLQLAGATQQGNAASSVNIGTTS